MKIYEGPEARKLTTAGQLAIGTVYLDISGTPWLTATADRSVRLTDGYIGVNTTNSPAIPCPGAILCLHGLPEPTAEMEKLRAELK